MGFVMVELKLKNAADATLARRGFIDESEIRRASVQGLVDAGATRLVIPQKIADQLGVREVGETRVKYADNRTTMRKLVGEVQIELCDRDSVFRALVEPDRETALIGAIVMEDLDLIVDCGNHKLQPRDPDVVVSNAE